MALCIATRVIVGLLGIGSIALIASVGWIFRPDFWTTSRNVESRIQYDPGFPFIGFWRVNCSDDFGLAIEKADANDYYVRFCGPGGCFGKGPFTRTSLITDGNYRVVGNDSVGTKVSSEFSSQLESLPATDRLGIEHGIQGGFLMYRRCGQSGADQQHNSAAAGAGGGLLK
jgi:hypothetical protein